ncbi:Two-component response regulator [Candidatus Burkholderia verschuerenii]|uniref:Two-component response regulator n=1 Tax=Candidatus Burkholderia verschuerenii TaxID=242163 RepID=A0A0L0ME22_9BURK|nr:response regulator transcription factor [Candidatus Burkholderia verschuerenii]KND60525.1 Two-component response regulator [Candidatus Burkholderia verschuerenii]
MNETSNITSPIRVIVADDHPAVVKGIQTYMERDGHFQVVATANDTLMLAEVIDSTPCDYIFTDIGMRGIDGESNAIAFLRRLSWYSRRPKIVAVTIISQGQMLAGLIQLGIDGVVDKRDGLDCLPEAVHMIAGGSRYLSPSAKNTVDRFPSSTPACAGVLSRRELEVFHLYASGLLVEEIAERFGRSTKTIATQKRNGMRKLGLDSEVELVEYMRQIGLV